MERTQRSKLLAASHWLNTRNRPSGDHDSGFWVAEAYVVNRSAASVPSAACQNRLSPPGVARFDENVTRVPSGVHTGEALSHPYMSRAAVVLARSCNQISEVAPLRPNAMR